MHSPATDSGIPHELKEYLATCGLSRRTINRCTLETRLYHDLGIYGDIAEAFMEVLADSYKVDLSNFSFYQYFPGEFKSNSWLRRFIINCIPWGRAICKNDHAYAVMTLRMVLDSIRTGKFDNDAFTSD